jgi:timeless
MTSTIRDDKDFSHLLSFSVTVMTSFAECAKSNPLLYVESLFRHPVPHRFCEQMMNHYVNEELR